jgi:tetratricopeptide (TPR) repeat protein
MAKKQKAAAPRSRPGISHQDAIVCLSLALLILVPLAFTRAVYTKYSLPKFVVLLVGASALLLVMAQRPVRLFLKRDASRTDSTSLIVKVVYCYFAAVAVSTIFGVASLVSLFGSHFNHMGLITLSCFFIVFVALIVGIGDSETRLRVVLSGIAATGALIAAYAVTQSFGLEPFVPRRLYTFPTPEGPIVRVCGSLGHADYLGNFLCYTTLLTGGFSLAIRGWRRVAALVATGLSIVAVALSGTRGAWVGLVAGAIAFGYFALKDGLARRLFERGPRFAIAAGVICVALLIALFVLSPAARGIPKRLRQTIAEGASGAGRSILWRDSLRMLPAFALVGTGPEGFRKALLGFKSIELARVNPLSNNESSHNSYLDEFISYGIVGGILYLAMIVLSLTLLLRVRRQSKSEAWRMITIGFIASFAAVLVHNIFIYDQIATGLYFFAFVSIAVAMSRVFNVSNKGNDASKQKQAGAKTKDAARQNVREDSWGFARVVKTAAAAACLFGSIWYSAGLIESDAAYGEMFDSSRPVDLNRLKVLGERVTGGPDPARQYDFLFARAVETFIQKLPAASQAAGAQAVDVKAIREEALQIAISHVEKSLAHTLTPDLNYSLLASLSLAAGDTARLQLAASEALKWDPYNYFAHLLMSDAYLAQGQRDQAIKEAEAALDLRPASLEVAAAVARARGENQTDDSDTMAITAQARNASPSKRSSNQLVEAASKFSQAGKLTKARVMLITAVGRANGPCPECHRELAIVYEKMARNAQAITEWETYIAQDPESASAGHIKERLERLKQTNNSKQP